MYISNRVIIVFYVVFFIEFLNLGIFFNVFQFLFGRWNIRQGGGVGVLDATVGMIVFFILCNLNLGEWTMIIDDREVERVREDAKRIEFIISSVKAVLKDKTANRSDWEQVKRCVDRSIVDTPLVFRD